jgi:D-alanine-D-alanine ligase
VKALVVYNKPVLPESHPDYFSEIDIVDSVQAAERVLRDSGYEVTTFASPSCPAAFERGIREAAPDVVVNLFEGSADNNATEMYAAGVLEWLGVPYTGCSFQSIVLARSKHIAKRIFVAEGVPTPAFQLIESVPVRECGLTFPVIVKPAQQDASIGLSQASVVEDLEGLNERAAWLLEELAQPALAEEMILGREITVAVVEIPDLRVLPGTEVVFPPESAGLWPILSYEAKWDDKSAEFIATDYDFKPVLEPTLLARVEDISKRAFRALGCRDYARVDFRIRKGDNTPFVLEVNPNPDCAPDRALTNNLWSAGIEYADFLRQMVSNALARKGQPAAARFSPRAAV